VEFGAEVSITYVMGGLARDYGPEGESPYSGDLEGLALHWLEVAEATRMPFDPRLWTEGPIASTYPACLALRAAAEQRGDRAYLRALREGLMCFRRKLDTREALVEEARRAGLDVPRFRIALDSHGTVEEFGNDLERTCTVPDGAPEDKIVDAGDGRKRVTFPTIELMGEDGRAHWVFGYSPYEDLRDAALAAGASPLGEDAPTVLDALKRFGRLATAEVEAVCNLPEPKAAAELWAMAAEWRVKPLRVLTGHLWEVA